MANLFNINLLMSNIDLQMNNMSVISNISSLLNNILISYKSMSLAVKTPKSENCIAKGSYNKNFSK